MQEGLIVQQNFTGCFENLYLNSTNFIRHLRVAFEEGEHLRFERVNTLYSCPEPPIIPVTFLTRNSYARLKGYEGMKTMNVSFYFRTYEERGVMLHHDFTSTNNAYVKLYLEDGSVKVEIKTNDQPTPTILDNYDEKFNDGRWHSLVLTVGKNNLVLDIDQRPMRTTKLINIFTGGWYYFAGGKSKDGFVGCMRMMSVDGNYKLPTDWKDEEYCCKNEVVFDACHMTDRCNPNPCKHNGVCKQNSLEFFCDCANTGYAGAVCHTCEDYSCA